MLEFSNKKDQDSVELIKIVSLLIHAAKIDENYTEKEKELINNFIINFAKKNPTTLKNKTSSQILIESEKHEKDSNHILEFTREIKKMDIKIKTFVLETLWEIVLSDNKSGIYESNLIRRICGLLYIPDKISGEIKLGVMNKNK
tara:strand:- start:1030 stop:1461 length:432 start_codon:yes stop_codon:yes gene_type:complete